MTRAFDNPVLMKRIAGILIIVSVVEWMAAGVFGWVNSVAYVSHLSQLAIVVSLVPYWQGLRIEARQVEVDIPKEVAEKIVETTNLEPAD